MTRAGVRSSNFAWHYVFYLRLATIPFRQRMTDE